MHSAALFHQLASLLLRALCTDGNVDLSQLSAKEKRELLKSKLDRHGNTALHISALRNKPKLFKHLLCLVIGPKRFDMLKQQNNAGNTVLHQAMQGGNTEVVKFIYKQLRESETEELLAITNEQQLTALDCAIRSNKTEVALLVRQYYNQKEEERMLKQGMTLNMLMLRLVNELKNFI